MPHYFSSEMNQELTFSDVKTLWASLHPSGLVTEALVPITFVMMWSWHRNQESGTSSRLLEAEAISSTNTLFNDNWLFRRCKYSVSIKSFHPLQEKESSAILKGKNHLTIECDVIKAAIEHSNLWIWRHYLGLSPLKLSVWYIYTDRERSQTEFSW